MANRVQQVKPACSGEAKAWLRENIREQEKRHAAIQKEMNEDLAAQRERWYQEFLQIVQTKGYNVTGDQRRAIKPSEVPKKPKRPERVVY